MDFNQLTLFIWGQLVLKQNLLSIFSEGDDSCLTVSVDDCKILSKEEAKDE